MSSPPEMLSNWYGCVLVAGLGDGVAVATEPLLCRLPSFTTVLGSVRTCPITLGTCSKIQDVLSRAGQVTLDGQYLPCVADSHRLLNLSKLNVSVRAQSAFGPPTPLETLLSWSAKPVRRELSLNNFLPEIFASPEADHWRLLEHYFQP